MADKVVNIDKARSERAEEYQSRVVCDVGGGIDEFGVALCIYGDDLNPEEISQILRIEPTSAHRKGERKKPRRGGPARTVPSKTGAWIYKLRGVAPQEPEEIVNALLDRLTQYEADWAALASRYRVCLNLGLHIESWNREFHLSPTLMGRIAQTNAELGFDIYAYLEPEDD